VVTSGGQAVFAVVAKDSASKTLKGVGKSFGTLKRNGISALKGIAGASVAAAGALAAFTGSAIKGAIEDERSNILLTAALKARGFELDKILPKIQEQIVASRRLGQSDDEVRAGHRNSCLVLHGDVNHITLRRLHPSSVYQAKLESVPLRNRDQPVPCCSSTIFNNCSSLTDETIKERALPNIRSPNERNERQALLHHLLIRSLATAHWALGSVIEVVRYCGVAAEARASRAISPALPFTDSVPASSAIRAATRSRSSIGVLVPPVTPTRMTPANGVGSRKSAADSI
jgi:hypothetical protein